MVSSLEIGVDHFDQLIRRVRVKRARILLAVDQMGADVVFHHLRHQARDAAANAGNHVHDALAAGLLSQRALDRLDLAANAANASEQFFLFPDRMGHGVSYRVPPYAMSIKPMAARWASRPERGRRKRLTPEGMFGSWLEIVDPSQYAGC